MTITNALVLFAVVIPSITTVYSFMSSREVSRSKTAERRTEAARTNSQRQLVSSLITQARAQRMSSLHNKRASVLSTIARANEILQHTPMDSDLGRNLKVELCNEAVAALALPSFETDFEVALKPSIKQISEMSSLVDDRYVLSMDQKREGQ